MPKKSIVSPDISTFQLYPLGDAAIVIQFSDTIAAETHRCITALAAYINQHPFTGFTETVPAYTSLTVYYDPWVVSRKGLVNPYLSVVETLQQSLAKVNWQASNKSPRVMEIPVCYGGDYGPDLAFVAAHANLKPEEVIKLHSSAAYTVYMIGFVPGFPYLGGLPDAIAAPRKETPRTIIPAGSVGIAGQQTGIYPLETPGGWQLIGRTPLSLFDLNRAEPSLLQAGDIVKFVAISAAEFEERKEPVR